MNKLVILRGIPASGKTTWAKEWVQEFPEARARVNRDDLRLMMFGQQAGLGFSQENAVTRAESSMVGYLLSDGYNVCVDNMNVRPKYVRGWIKFAKTRGADYEIVEFPVDVDTSVKRDYVRGEKTGKEAILTITEKFLQKGELIPVQEDQESEPPRKYTPRPRTPPAVMVDIDGTVALKAADRDIYDLSRVSEDTANDPVIEAVRDASESGNQILYCSGREESVRKETSDWISRNVGVPGLLHMRKAGDRRKDYIVKQELFDQFIRDYYNVRYILDDRDQVVNMWREMGLTCFQVAPGDF